MYQVGFGDAFLFTFRYPKDLEDGRKERHLLMDFGSTSSPPGGSTLDRVADDLESVTNGQLDVIAVSHRHKDHLSGFGAKARKTQIGQLAPKLIVRSWTEDPTAPADFRGPSSFGDSSRRFAQALSNGQQLMAQIETALTELKEHRESKRLGGHRGELLKAAVDEISNKAAVDALEEWGTGADAEFLHFGMKSKIENVVPGVKVQVIGPPPIEQRPGVGGDRSRDPEYWMLHQRRLSQALNATGLDTTPKHNLDLANVEIKPGRVRWLVERLRDHNIAHLARIVRELDDSLNNTSLILCIDAGDKRMLLPGDAQIENWAYALKHSTEPDGFDSETVKAMLADVDFYKVGHHGSRNATPRTLFNLWDAPDKRDRPMLSMMCTKSGVHGESDATRVPRATLRDALARRTTLYTTDELQPEDQLFVDVEAKLQGGHSFEYAGPADPSGGLFVPKVAPITPK
jgi:hypothetical protein